MSTAAHRIESQEFPMAASARKPDFVETIEIAASPERIWDVTLDLAHWPDWTPTVETVEVLDPGPVRVGTRARLKQPGNRPAVWTVTRIDEGKEFVWEARTMGTVVSAIHHLEPTPTGTRVTLAIEVSGPTKFLFGFLVNRVSKRFVPQEAIALKAWCERS